MSATRPSGGFLDDVMPTARGLQGQDHQRRDHGSDRPGRRLTSAADLHVATTKVPEPPRFRDLRVPVPVRTALRSRFIPSTTDENGRASAPGPELRGESSGPTGTDEPLAVELTGIEKRFPGVMANKDVSLKVRTGTIHAIVGENGAGKSTLMKTLYGMHQPDEGTIAVIGTEVTFKSPTEAIEAGIGMVHQHFMLADNLTVLENVILGVGADAAAAGSTAATAAQRFAELAKLLGAARRPRRAGRRARRRRAAAGRDHQGALPRRPDPDPRRADRRAGAAGGRRAVRQPPRARRRRRDHHLHLAQARRGAGDRRRHHRHPAPAPRSAL